MLPSVSFAQPVVVVPTGSPDLSGRWSGYWVSDKNGHTGPLRATFRQQDCDTYRVTYKRPVREDHSVPLIRRWTWSPRGAAVAVLSAERPLGLGGSYRHDGRR